MSELIRPGHRGPDQFVKVHRVIESERINGMAQHRVQPQAVRVEDAPVRCQLWDDRRLIATVPVTFDDMGHPSDIVFQPGEAERITRLAFIWSGRVFAYPLGEVFISPSEPLHLALGHLKLRDKFGNLVLQAGKG